MIGLAVASLAKRLILVVEDEYMIADEMVTVLASAGAVALGPVANVEDALHLLASEHLIDAAVLDVNLLGEAVWPVIDALLQRNVPVVLSTGYDAGAIPAKYALLPRCEKPTTGRDITKALEAVISR